MAKRIVTFDTMCGLNNLLENNRIWAEKCISDDSQFFQRLSEQQKPKYMWIGCSDSRVPANEITGLEPGMVFVHRNVANQVHHTDLNILAAVQYAVEVLGVEHLIVTGHYGCGGVRVAMGTQHHGMVDNWIRSIRDVYVLHEKELSKHDEPERFDRLCELNVMRQVENLCHTRIVQNAWNHGKPLTVHGWIYELKDGLLHDLHISKSSKKDVRPIYWAESSDPV